MNLETKKGKREEGIKTPEFCDYGLVGVVGGFSGATICVGTPAISVTAMPCPAATAKVVIETIELMPSAVLDVMAVCALLWRYIP